MNNIDFKKYKSPLIVVLVLVLIIGGIYYYQNREFEFKLEFDENGEITYPNKKFGESLLSYQERIVDYEKGYIKYKEEFDKQDNYGGETPEETLDLYIQALEKSDFELASKYFVLKDQKKELGELLSLSVGEIDSYLEVLNTANPTSYNDTFDEYELRGRFNDKDILISGFIKNKETDIWKLESM